MTMVYAVFAAFLIAAWGTGEITRRLLRNHDAGTSRLAGPVISLTLGFGVIGQLLYLLGIPFRVYNKPFLWALLILGIIAAGYCLATKRPRLPEMRGVRELSIAHWAVLALSAVYLVRWFKVLRGFTTGSDVFSHHYMHAQFMARIGKFGHEALLPLGRDHLSNYNPSLAHVLYTIGHVLADERVSNLFHWFQQLLVLAALYVVARELHSRAAGVFAIGIYSTCGILATFPLDVHDYTLVGIGILAVMQCVTLYRRNPRRDSLLLAAILAGLMMSTKYYGGVMAGVVTLVLLFGKPAASLVERIRRGAIFGGIAWLVYAPWPLYNWITVGSPFYPIISNDLMPRIYAATLPVRITGQYAIPSDTGTLYPKIFGVLNFFLGFQYPGSIFALSAIFLIGIPLSIYAVTKRRDDEEGTSWTFLLAIGIAVALWIAVSRTAFYKWFYFFGLPYAVSLSVLAYTWTRSARRALWAAVLLLSFMNYRSHAGDVISRYPSYEKREQRANDMARDLNKRLPRKAVIAGTNYMTTYDLRPDLKVLEEQEGMGTDWPAEEKILREAGVQFLVVPPREAEATREYYTTVLKLWEQLEPQNLEQPKFLRWMIAAHAERTKQKEAFLARHGKLLHTYPDGSRLLQIRW